MFLHVCYIFWYISMSSRAELFKRCCPRFLFLLFKSVSSANFTRQFESSHSQISKRKYFAGIRVVKL